MTKHRIATLAWLIAGSGFGLACGSIAQPEEDGRDDSFVSGKADVGGIVDGSAEANGILAVVNQASDGVLRAAPPDGIGLSDHAVDNLLDLRLGHDGQPGTDDDGSILTLAELDAIPFIGPVALQRLLVYARNHGYVEDGTASPRLALNVFFSCRRSDHGVDCWGNNDEGELGNGTTVTSLTPTPVVGLPGKVLEIAAGENHVCARIDNSAGAPEVVCWGYNGSGQLGDGTRSEPEFVRSVPAPVVDLPNDVVQLAAGSSHSCLLTSPGAVYCWGNVFIEGPDFSGHEFSSLTPTLMPELASGIVEIAAGGQDTCARKVDGSVVCWGPSYGSLRPQAVVGLESGITAISVGARTNCALRHGTALCWGANNRGELGDGTTVSRTNAAPIAGLQGHVAAVSSSSFHSCARTTEGGAVCWGVNERGALGDGSVENRNKPTPVVGLSTGVVEVAAGPIHSCALRVDGRTLCWGSNSYGVLGNGTTTDSLTPRLVSN